MVLKFLFIFILLHGLIHLTGFVKEFDLAGANVRRTKLFRSSSKPRYTAGSLWLINCTMFMLTGVAALVHKQWWWMLAAAAIILSQTLIIIFWKDAKWGTVANLLILPIVIVSFAGWSFNKMIAEEVNEMMAHAVVKESKIIKPEMTMHLPYCVQQWLSHSGVVGKEAIHTVHLKQKGAMCTEPAGAWLPTEAEQYFTTDTPAFVWNAKVHMMPMVTVAGRDKYENGKGNMLIKAFSLIPVVNASGTETDQGTMLRYLGEMCWFPSGALSPYITWKELSATEAMATMSYKGLTVSGIYTFSPNGDFLSFSAKRYMNNKGKITLEDWYVPATEWREMNGVRIPVKGLVTWKLKAEDFDYYKWEITAIAYNKATEAI